jgi:heat shock protein HtpX
MSILAPIAAMLIQMAVSRSREYQADATGARLAGSSEGLASALAKLESFSKQRPMQANPSTAHMFIVNPLSGSGMMHLFSTHPPMAQRIARLRGTRPTAGPQQMPPPNRQDPLDRGREFWDRLS